MDVFKIDNDVFCWPEQMSSIMIKAVTGLGDPVELDLHDARALAEALLRYVRLIEEADR